MTATNSSSWSDRLWTAAKGATALLALSQSGTARADSTSGCTHGRIRELNQCLPTPTYFKDTVAPGEKPGMRKMLDTSWHNPLASAPGNAGLNVGLWHRGTDHSQASPPIYSSILNEITYAKGNAPAYTFQTGATANNNQGIVLPYQPTNGPTSTFLGSYATGAAAADTAPLDTTLMNFYGYMQFPAQGTYQFNLAVGDDAAAVYLGGTSTPGTGTLVVERNFNSGIASAPGLPNPLHIDIFPVNGVQQTGWYPVSLFYYNQYDLNGGSNFGNAGLNWQVSGPAAVAFSTYTGATHSPYPGPNPLHQYAFNENGGTTVVDSSPADNGNGALVGGATLSGGNLVTSGNSRTQAATLSAGDMGYFTGSFSLGHWFTLADHTPSFQTLFCFGSDTQNYLIGHPQRGGDGMLSVEFGINNQATLLRAPIPAVGTQTKLFVTYEGTTNQAALYVNNALQATATLPSAFNLASITSQNNDYFNIGGISPWGDPSLSGTSNQFNIYREALSAQLIADVVPA